MEKDDAGEADDAKGLFQGVRSAQVASELQIDFLTPAQDWRKRRLELQQALTDAYPFEPYAADPEAAGTLLRTQALWFGTQELSRVGLSQFRQIAIFMNPCAQDSSPLLYAIAERHSGRLSQLSLKGLDGAPDILGKFRGDQKITALDYLQAVSRLTVRRRWQAHFWEACVPGASRHRLREHCRWRCILFLPHPLSRAFLDIDDGDEANSVHHGPLIVQVRRIMRALARVLIRFQRSLKPLPGPPALNPWSTLKSRNWVLQPSNDLGRRRRCQALGAFPGFTQLLRTDAELGQVVDTGRPLIPAIARVLAVPNKHVIRLAAYSWAHIHALDDGDWRTFLNVTGRRASFLPLPDSAQDWTIVRILQKELGAWTPEDAHSGLHALWLDTDWLLRFKARTWEALAYEICAAADAPDLADAFRRLRETVALFRFCFAEAAVPQATGVRSTVRSPQDLAQNRFTALFAAKHPRSILRFAADLSRAKRLGEKDSDVDWDYCWRRLLPNREPHPSGRFMVREADTPRALEAAGVTLRNCLKSYIDRCSSECLRVFSLEDESGRTLAAFSVTWTVIAGRTRFVMMQIKSADNEDASSQEIEAATAFVQSLDVEEVRVRAEAIWGATSLIELKLTSGDPMTVRRMVLSCLDAYIPPTMREDFRPLTSEVTG